MFSKLIDERLEEITKLHKKVNPDDSIYRCKGSTADEKFNEFDNALSLLDKIRDSKIILTDAKNDQAEFKSDLSEIKKGNKNHRSKDEKIHCIISKCFTKQGKKLLNFLMIILQ